MCVCKRRGGGDIYIYRERVCVCVPRPERVRQSHDSRQRKRGCSTTPVRERRWGGGGGGRRGGRSLQVLQKGVSVCHQPAWKLC